MTKQQEIIDSIIKSSKNQSEALKKIRDRFNWTIQQAYIATDSWYRPKNVN